LIIFNFNTLSFGKVF